MQHGGHRSTAAGRRLLPRFGVPRLSFSRFSAATTTNVSFGQRTRRPGNEIPGQYTQIILLANCNYYFFFYETVWWHFWQLLFFAVQTMQCFFIYTTKRNPIFF
jgi:hypothetical protein